MALLEQLHAEGPDGAAVAADLERARAGVEATHRYDELCELLRQERWSEVLTGMQTFTDEFGDFGDPDDLVRRAEAERTETTVPSALPEHEVTTASPTRRRAGRTGIALAVVAALAGAGVVATLVLRSDDRNGSDPAPAGSIDSPEDDTGGEGGDDDVAEPVRLVPEQRIRVGDRLETGDGRYWLEMTVPEGLRAFKDGHPDPWFVAPLRFPPPGDAVTIIQEDGNLVMYAFDPAPGEIMPDDTVVWDAGTSVPGASLVLVEEGGSGVLDIRAPDGEVVLRLGESPPG